MRKIAPSNRIYNLQNIFLCVKITKRIFLKHLWDYYIQEHSKEKSLPKLKLVIIFMFMKK